MRCAKISRKTDETKIELELNIDGVGKNKITTDCNLLTHMIKTICVHGMFDITLNAKGDDLFDNHHLIEDVGIVLGQAFRKALGDKLGINRSGFFMFPMDESLGTVAIDISGRSHTVIDLKVNNSKYDYLEFFNGFSRGLLANIHIKVEYGNNDHHKLESVFKAFSRALKIACMKNKISTQIPSAKGLI
ncbi:MAG: imidazoleglycerol-phosphate dehydratase [Candidatus Woesearchaeota archaeon]|jgi:imidazoleglycerol-phosphate dehydratase